MESKYFNKRQLNALSSLEVKTKDEKGIMRGYDEIMLDVEAALRAVNDIEQRNELRGEIIGLYEYRKANMVGQLRAIGDMGTGKKLRGYPVLFNSPTVLYGDWKEVIAETAFDGVDLSNLMLLLDHDTGKPLGRNGKNLRAEVDKLGLFIEAEMPDTVLGNDTYTLVKAEIIDGMSFWFVPEVIETDWENKIDTIKKFRKVPEVSIVTFPAYPQTVVMPSEDESQEETRKEKEDEEAQKRSQENKLRLLSLELEV